MCKELGLYKELMKSKCVSRYGIFEINFKKVSWHCESVTYPSYITFYEVSAFKRKLIELARNVRIVTLL